MRVEYVGDPNEVREWIFTFGGGHTHPITGELLRNRFVRVSGTFSEARRTMASVFGVKWSHQYRTEEDAGVARFRLIELELTAQTLRERVEAIVADGLCSADEANEAAAFMDELSERELSGEVTHEQALTLLADFALEQLRKRQEVKP